MPKHPKLLLSLAVSALAASASAQLQPPRGQPRPAPALGDPYQALSFFEGQWTIAGLPAGTRFDEACAWLPSTRRHLVCRSRTESANGVQEGLGVFSYRAGDGMYVYRSFDPNGEVDTLEGRLVDGVWHFSGLAGAGANARRTRITISPGGERSFRLSQEIATGTGAFVPQPDVHYVPSVAATTAR
jgi:hypothetical protein